MMMNKYYQKKNNKKLSIIYGDPGIEALKAQGGKKNPKQTKFFFLSKWAEQKHRFLLPLMLPPYNLNMNGPHVINIQILQLFSCLKCTRQQILSTLRRQRSLATVLPIGTEPVSAWVCLRIIMGCWERKRERGGGERGCLSLLIMLHHFLSIDPYGWSCLQRSQVQNCVFLKDRKKTPELCNKQTTKTWLVEGWTLSGFSPPVFTQYAL